MKITIDTKEDSEHEIKKAIKLLVSLVGSGNVYSNDPDFVSSEKKTKNIFDDNEPAPNLMGMFDSSQEPDEPVPDPDEPEPDAPDEPEVSSQVEFY